MVAGVEGPGGRVGARPVLAHKLHRAPDEAVVDLQ